MARMLGFFLLVGAFAAAALSAAAPGQAAAPVETRLEVWRDEARGRDIPVKLYLPETAGPAPVVIFSHGLGGSREAAPYLGERWAQEGFLGVFIQHPGSDASVWEGLSGQAAREALAQAATGRNAFTRFQDLPFVIDEIEARAASGALPADPERIAMAGHSFGAHSVLAAAGRVYVTPRGAMDFADSRIDAGIMLSPPPPPADESAWPSIYGSIEPPLMHITGTQDESVLEPDTDPADRLIPFREIDGPPQYLIVFDPGDHSVFSGTQRRRREPAWYPDVQADVADLTNLFLRVYLLEDGRAAQALSDPGLAETLRHPASIDRKDAP